MKIEIPKIEVGKRFREDMGDLESLATSINIHGLIHPICVEEKAEGGYILIAGERRLRAHMQLGLVEIDATLRKDLSELERKEIESEENINRHQFTWVEEIKIKRELHRIKKERYGAAVKGFGGGWGLKHTAESLGESVGQVSGDLSLAEALIEFPELAKEKSKTAAAKRFKRMMERMGRAELASRIVVPVEVGCLVKGDSTQLMRLEKDETYDLIYTDPPYGVDYDKSGSTIEKWGEKSFGDDHYKSMELLEQVMKEGYRILKPETHAYVWFSMSLYSEVKRVIESAGFIVYPTPIIWAKEGSAAPASTPYMYSSTYESCFLCCKGHRQLNMYLPNLMTYSRVPPKHKIHPTEKPVAMIQKMIEASTVAGDSVLDPFAGSCSTLVATYMSRRKPKGFEIEDQYYNAGVVRLTDLQKIQQFEKTREVEE